MFGAFLVAGFLLAAYLEPNPQGYGTHRALGLPPCSMKIMFNIPCPACGMTTSFAHFVRGQLPSSVRANAAGTLLAAVCVFLLPWSFASAWKARYMWLDEPAKVFAIALSVLAGFTIVLWLWRLWANGYV